MVSRYGNEAAPLLLQAARRLEPFDLSLARRAYMTAWSAAVTAHHLGGADALREICRAVRALPPLPPDPHPLDLVLEGFAVLITDGHAVATPVLQRAAKEALQLPVEDVVRWGFQVPGASSATWDDNAIVVYERQAQLVRDAGALAELPIHLQSLALERAWLGDLSGARRLMAESESISTSTGIQVPPFALLRTLALQGREAEASALIEAVIQQGTAQGQGIGVMVAYWAAAVLYNGLGRYEEAASAAGEVVTNGILPWLSMWALFELVEAAARVGDTKLGREALDRLAATTQPAGTSFALGIEARSRALLADGDDADKSYREAIEQFSRTRLRPELARTHLLYGEWLRREGRRVDARERLRTAHEMFVAIGMEAFAERTRRELLAAGATVRKRSPETRDELTPQEEQIARLARDGLSNPEIGAKLFLSRRTVEWHLGKVFAKLEVGSRADLRDALPTAELETAPG
jgi:DNA-binding CsgD family transcriptional regulator